MMTGSRFLVVSRCGFTAASVAMATLFAACSQLDPLPAVQNDGGTEEEVPELYDGCFEGDFELFNKYDAERISHYSCITGDLTIIGYPLDHLSLPHLQNISGDFFVEQNATLKTLDGLSALRFVEGDLRILQNDALEEIDFIADLENFDGDVLIDNNPSLAEVSALTALPDGLDITISNNDSIQTIDFGSMEFIKALKIQGNTQLEKLTMNGVGSIGTMTTPHWFLLERNPSLTTIRAGFLSVVYGYLFINENSSLFHLDGLESLDTVTGELQIGSNPKLATLEDVSSLTCVQGLVHIVSNPSLPQCEVCNLINKFYYDCTASLESSLNLEDSCPDDCIFGFER